MPDPSTDVNAASGPAISEIVAATTTSQLSCREHLDSRLQRCIALEGQIEAWAHLDPELASAQAEALDATREGGPMFGVTVGVKDVIDTFDMPTEFGSEIHRGHRPPRDAACVALTRRAGGVVMGKTVTTEFANVTPGKTRNPFDRNRTPGGSSSGSAAAVAAGMVDVAIGTQTTGSTIRPASFCGVVGYRPSFGDLPTSGVMQVSGSVDTLGILARRVDDVAMYRDVLMGVTPNALPMVSAPRVGLCRTDRWRDLSPATREGIDGVVGRLTSHGAIVEEVRAPVDFDALEEAHRWITGFEMSRNLSWEIDHHWDELSDGLRTGRLQDGAACSEQRYRDMRDRAARARQVMSHYFTDLDVILAPAAVGEATGIESPVPHPWVYQPWTMLHVPTVTLPLLKGPAGLPVGVQMIGRFADDRNLLAVALWIEQRLGYPSAYGESV